MKTRLLKRTFELSHIKPSFWKSLERDKLNEELFENGVYQIKRVGNGNNSRLFVSFYEDSRSDAELLHLIKIITKKHGT